MSVESEAGFALGSLAVTTGVVLYCLYGWDNVAAWHRKRKQAKWRAAQYERGLKFVEEELSAGTPIDVLQEIAKDASSWDFERGILEGLDAVAMLERPFGSDPQVRGKDYLRGMTWAQMALAEGKSVEELSIQVDCMFDPTEFDEGAKAVLNAHHEH